MTNQILMAKLNDLRAGKEIYLDKQKLRPIPGKENGRKFEVGDKYYAARNSERLLTVRGIDKVNRIILPLEKYMYAFSFDECVGVELVQ